MRIPLLHRREHLTPAPFVVGVGRSGTTLLRLMLDAHPDLAMPPETGFVPDLIAAAKREGATPETLLEAVTGHRKWGDFPMSEQELLERWRGLERLRARGAVRAFFELYAAHQGKPRWGDKTPGYTMYMGPISNTLPEAHFVHVIRDGRAVALSRMRTLALRPTEISKVARRWQKRLHKARDKGANLDHYLEIRYEALIREPEQTLRQVAEFIDLPWDPGMLDYHERSSERLAELDRDIPAWGKKLPRSAESRMALHQQTTKPPDTARIDRWRDELSAEEIESFEREAGQTLTELGYELAAGGD
jgi:hypothetical protein